MLTNNSLRGQVDSLKKTVGKPAIFLMNYALKLEKDKNHEYKLVANIDNIAKEMMKIFRYTANKEDKLLLLIDDKDAVIKAISDPQDVNTFHKKNIENKKAANFEKIRKNYLSTPSKNILEDIFSKANITAPLYECLYADSKGRELFSELKLNAKSTLGGQNACAKMYDSLLKNVIDRSNFTLVSLIPNYCRANIGSYLQNDDYMESIEEQGGKFLTAFIEADGGIPQIIEI